MGMTLPAVEPEAGPWQEMPLSELVELIVEAAAVPAGRPVVLAVDGRSASGKSTLGRMVQSAVPRSAMVSTDDIAWNQSFFDWGGLLATGVLEPVRRGESVRFRPPAWEQHGRPGSIEVPAGLDLLVVEGVGAGRRQLEALLDAVVWVQADVELAERRGLARDLAADEHGSPEAGLAFWHEWLAEELLFLADERPWERATVVVAGTPPEPPRDGHVLVAAPPGGAGLPA